MGRHEKAAVISPAPEFRIERPMVDVALLEKKYKISECPEALQWPFLHPKIPFAFGVYEGKIEPQHEGDFIAVVFLKDGCGGKRKRKWRLPHMGYFVGNSLDEIQRIVTSAIVDAGR